MNLINAASTQNNTVTDNAPVKTALIRDRRTMSDTLYLAPLDLIWVRACIRFYDQLVVGTLMLSGRTVKFPFTIEQSKRWALRLFTQGELIEFAHTNFEGKTPREYANQRIIKNVSAKENRYTGTSCYALQRFVDYASWVSEGRKPLLQIEAPTPEESLTITPEQCDVVLSAHGGE